jgi:hypothetical protein
VFSQQAFIIQFGGEPNPMKRNCTNLMTATAATTVLALGGMLSAGPTAMTAPDAYRGHAKPAPQQIGGAPLIWDNGNPDGANGISHFEGNLAGPGALERDAADDFQTGSAGGSGWQVNGVQMSGVWFGGANAPGPLTALRVRIWNDAGGQPGSVFYDATVGFNATNTGGTYFDRPEISYTADVNVVLDENTTYWIGIQPVGTTDNFFHLTSATGEGTPPEGSCVGSCGGQSPDGCWCDEGCCGFGDCCADKLAECGGCDPAGGLAIGGGLQGEELHIRGDFDPFLADWAPGSQVFGDEHDLTFKIFGVPAVSNCPADLNGDNVVNVSDLLILLGAWGACPGCDADLNGDDVVNVSDLLILLGAWGACPAPPAPTGACCFDDGSCTPDLTASECDDIDGNYGGNFSSCGSCPQPPNGETCDLALPINIGDTATANTTGNPVGNAPGCGDALAPNSATVWYSVVGNGTTLTADTCASSIGAGTNVAVYCSSCTAPICVAGSTENFDCFDNPFNGSATWCAGDGETYYIAVWGDGAAGDVSLTVTSNGASCEPNVSCEPVNLDTCEGSCGAQSPGGCWCDEQCCGFGDCCDDKLEVCGGCDPNPPAPECDEVNCDDTEGEPCGDDVNNGCSADPPSALFGNISLGGSVCGNLWADGGTRDLDWYLFTITEPTEVTVTMSADEESVAFIASATDFSVCAGVDLVTSAAGCEVTITACLNPGEYAMIIGASVFDGFACPGYQYTATITGTPVDECDDAPAGSCAGSCGGQSPDGCWCDEGCCGFGDCCADKLAQCGGCDPDGGGGPAGSCAGACGGQSPDGCWCDDGCAGFGDCCPDVCDECPGTAGC